MAIHELMQNLGLESNLSKLGIQTKQDITQIIDNGFNPQRINNNPREVTKQALRALLVEKLNDAVHR